MMFTIHAHPTVAEALTRWLSSVEAWRFNVSLGKSQKTAGLRARLFLSRESTNKSLQAHSTFSSGRVPYAEAMAIPQQIFA